MTPLEFRPQDPHSAAILRGMLDAGRIVEGQPVEPYEGPHPDVYAERLQSWLADLTAAAAAPLDFGVELRMVPAPLAADVTRTRRQGPQLPVMTEGWR